MTDLPLGEIVGDPAPGELPSHAPIVGKTVRLDPPNAERDAPGLFAATHTGRIDPGQWAYMPYGPFSDEQGMRNWIRATEHSQDPLFFVVRKDKDNEPIGMVSFMNISAEHRRLELGHIWYVPAAQRTTVNTETIYLMLRESFDKLRCRRVEWKCDLLNERSKSAALRLGFSFEGSFGNTVS